MSEELVYTSAQEGLKRGSHGFCTVISTPGVSRSLADRLESLSGYRHHFPPHDAQSKLNPVNFFHYVVSVGGDRFNVLSRVCNAGLDYTQRSNKLAHHVALRRDELVSCGPAAVQSTPGFHDETFDGNPRHLGSGRTPSDVTSTLSVCDAWKRASGDAGWAGYLAEAFLESRGQYVSVVYPVGADVLPLISEALSLVPGDRRWEVTYSTYVTRLPAGVDCHWRFYLDGSKEANSLKRNPHAQVIDLTATPGRASGGDLAEAARTGLLPEPIRKRESKPDRSVAVEKTKPKVAAVPTDAEKSDREALAVHVPPVPDDASGRSGDIPPVLRDTKTTAATPPGLPGQSSESHAKPELDFSGKPASPYKIYSAVVTAVLLLVIVGVVINAIQPEIEGVTLPGESGEGDSEVVAAPSPEVDDVERRQQEENRKKLDQAEVDRKRKELEVGTRKKSAAKKDDTGKKPPKGRDADTKPPRPKRDKRDPLKDIKARGKILVLPETNAADLLASKAKQRLLATLYTNRLRDCRLELISGLIARPSVIYKLAETSSKETGRRIWTVSRVPKENKGIGDVKPLTTPIGTFELKSYKNSSKPPESEQRLYFSWDRTVPPAEMAEVRLMDLRIGVGAIEANCELNRPKSLGPISIVFDKKSELGNVFPRDVIQQIGKHRDHVYLDLKLIGFEQACKVKRDEAGGKPESGKGAGKDAARKLQKLRPGRTSIRVILERMDGATRIQAVTMSFKFNSPNALKNKSQISVTWACWVPAAQLNTVSLVRTPNFTMAFASKGESTVANWINTRKTSVKIFSMMKRQEMTRSGRVAKLLAANPSANTKMSLVAMAVSCKANIGNYTKSIMGIEGRIESLKGKIPYVKALAGAMKSHHKTAYVEWRLYIQRGNREKTLAIGDRRNDEKRPAR